MDLEEEFQKLIQDCYDKVMQKSASGELSTSEAADLILMLRTRTAPPIESPAWSESTQNCIDLGTVISPICPDGHTHECGWSSSMGYHCF